MFSLPPRPAVYALILAVLVASAVQNAGAGPLFLEDQPALLQPEHPRTEADRDRVEAISMFAAGRMLQRQQKNAEALRLYQRALRCDPGAATVARAIVPLAFRLQRHAVAVRYALKAAELDQPDPLLLRRLGGYLTAHGDWTRAVELYEKALAARAGADETAADILLQMEMGRLYHLVESYDKAAECFKHVLHALDHPDEFALDDDLKNVLLGKPGTAYNLFGECFLKSGRLDEAAAAFRKSHEIAPNNGLLELNLARIDVKRDKPAEALKHLQACFNEKVTDEGIAPYRLLAEVLEKLGRSEELIGRLEKLHDDNTVDVPLGYFLAEQYLNVACSHNQIELRNMLAKRKKVSTVDIKTGQYGKAEQLYIALVEKSPTPTGYRNLAKIYQKTDRYAKLLDTLGKSVEKTGVLETLGAEAQTISSDAKLMKALIETARKRHKAEPEKLGFGTSIAVALLAVESEQFDAADKFFRLALLAKPDRAAELLLVWGTALRIEGRPAEAAKIFQRAIDENALPKDNPLFYFHLAGALAEDDRIEETLSAARKAAEIKPDSSRYHGTVARILYYAKRRNEATEAYRRLIDKFDSDYESHENRMVMRDARLALSNLCVLQNNLTEAEEWLEQVLDEFPDDVGASNDLGYLWADQGKHLQRALRIIRHAVEAEPDNAAYRDSLGWVYYRLGRHKEAVAELEKAADVKDDPDAVILDHLGDAYLKVGKPEKAKDAWRRAAAAFQKQEQPDKAKTVREKLELEPQMNADK